MVDWPASTSRLEDWFISHILDRTECHLPPVCGNTSGMLSDAATTYAAVGIRSSANDWSTVLEDGRSRLLFPIGSLDFSIDLMA